MDLSGLVASISNRTTNKRYAKNASVISALNRTKFNASCLPQSFSLPVDSIMHHITMNPTTSKVYQKLIQTCKYFFIKNPILVVPNLIYEDYEKWSINHVEYDLNKFTCRFWITDSFSVGYTGRRRETDIKPNLVSSLAPKLFRSDAAHLVMVNQVISFHDLSFHISSAEKAYFTNLTVMNDDNSIATIEKIVEAAVKAKEVSISEPASMSSNTMKELTKIQHFSKLDLFYLQNLTEQFDLETFYDYMKKNKITRIILRFDKPLCDAYKKRMGEIVDEILATKEFDYIPPFIGFPGIAMEKYEKLDNLHFSYHSWMGYGRKR